MLPVFLLLRVFCTCAYDSTLSLDKALTLCSLALPRGPGALLPRCCDLAENPGGGPLSLFSASPPCPFRSEKKRVTDGDESVCESMYGVLAGEPARACERACGSVERRNERDMLGKASAITRTGTGAAQTRTCLNKRRLTGRS